MLATTREITPLKLLELPSVQAEEIFNSLSLTEQVSFVLAAPWDRRHELIALSQRAMAIVRNMPPQELFWTIKAIGPADSLELLELASAEQIQFMFDLDCWVGDRLVPEKVLTWLVLLFEAGDTVVPNWLHWLRSRDEALLPCVLRMFAAVKKRPDDMDIQEARDVLPAFTLDDVYFLDFFKTETAPVIERLLKAVSDMSFEYYHGVMELILYQTLTEQMEEAYRFKTARLEEWGVPNYIDALEIYAPLVSHGIRVADGWELLQASQVSDVVPAFVPSLYVGEYPVLRQALQPLREDRVMERIVFEWIGVANKILVADACDLDDPNKMLAVLNKTSGFLNLGLELAAARQDRAPSDILAKGVLEDIVRFAMSELRTLSKEAHAICRSGLVPEDLSLLQDSQRNLLEGLLRDRPVFWDEKAFCYVEFCEMKQIDAARKVNLEVMEWAVLISRLLPHWSVWKGLVPWESTNIQDYKVLNWQTALCTALVKQLLTGMPLFEPLTVEELYGVANRYQTDNAGTRREFEDALKGLVAGASQVPSSGCEVVTVCPNSLRIETFLPAIDGLLSDLELFASPQKGVAGGRRSEGQPAAASAETIKQDLKYLGSLVVMTTGVSDSLRIPLG